jgi:hypothetical protein
MSWCVYSYVPLLEHSLFLVVSVGCLRCYKSVFAHHLCEKNKFQLVKIPSS